MALKAEEHVKYYHNQNGPTIGTTCQRVSRKGRTVFQRSGRKRRTEKLRRLETSGERARRSICKGAEYRRKDRAVIYFRLADGKISGYRSDGGNGAERSDLRRERRTR